MLTNFWIELNQSNEISFFFIFFVLVNLRIWLIRSLFSGENSRARAGGRGHRTASATASQSSGDQSVQSGSRRAEIGRSTTEKSVFQVFPFLCRFDSIIILSFKQHIVLKCRHSAPFWCRVPPSGRWQLQFHSIRIVNERNIAEFQLRFELKSSLSQLNSSCSKFVILFCIKMCPVINFHYLSRWMDRIQKKYTALFRF